MALDTRDYWKIWHNRRAGYRERAGIRVSTAEYQRQLFRKAWRNNFLRWGGVLLGVIVFLLMRKYWR